MSTSEYLNKITLGDSYKLIKNLDDKSVDLIVTDPPYLIESTTGGKNNDLGKSITNINNRLASGVLTEGVTNEILEEYIRVMKKPNIYIWCNHKQIPQYLDFFVTKHGCNFDILVWIKANAVPLYSNKYLTDKEYCLYFRKGGYCNPESYEDAKTWFIEPLNARDKEKYEHPTIKPYKLIERLIRNSSKVGGVILDTFIGSGTTAVAAKNTDRNYIGFEIDPKWCKIANDRVNGIDANGQQSFILF